MMAALSPDRGSIVNSPRNRRDGEGESFRKMRDSSAYRGTLGQKGEGYVRGQEDCRLSSMRVERKCARVK